MVNCPKCRTELAAGELHQCATCHGTWIAQATLAEHVREMQSLTRPTMRWARTHARLGLPCATCKHPMETLTLFDVSVDRCHSHGVWFGPGELAEVLRRSAQFGRRNDDDGDELALWMCADAGADLLDGTVTIAAEVAASAVSAGILEGVFDVIGGIFSSVFDAV